MKIFRGFLLSVAIIALSSVSPALGIAAGNSMMDALALAANQRSTATDQCTGTLTPTTSFTYSGLCTNFAQAECWNGGLPNSTSVAQIPTGVTVTLGNVSNLGEFALTSVGSLIIAAGATLHMPAQALQVMDCLIVNGKIELLASPVAQNHSAPTANSPYLPDPSQPEKTDCLLVSVGFTPRICGPGVLRIEGSGNVTLSNFYSSLFIETFVTTGASLTAGSNSFIWGRITNNGTFNTNGYMYMHGYLYNHGSAMLTAVAFDKWATSFVESPPLMIENYGTLNFTRFIHATNALYKDGTTGVYKAAVLNFGNTFFSVPPQGQSGASTDFDLFNFGTVTWKSSNWNPEYATNWGGSGNYINHATFVTDAVAVFLSTYHGVGGVLSHRNWGSFSFGSGSVNPRSVRLCTMQQSRDNKRLSQPIQRSPRRPDMVVQQRDGCWWYGDFCYHTPYIFSPPTLKTVAEGKPFVAKHSIAIQLSNLVSSVSVPAPCSQRYSFSGVNIVQGDGTGSLVSTLPLSIEGSLQIRVGGRWFALTENGNPPVWGGGKVRVENAGELVLGIDANFNHDGSIVVERGGSLSIPRHAKVIVSNHTIQIRQGAIFHVDGKLATNTFSAPIKNCGELRGNGRITKSKDSDLMC